MGGRDAVPRREGLRPVGGRCVTLGRVTVNLTELLHARPEDVARPDSLLLRVYWRAVDRLRQAPLAERAAALQAVAQADEPAALDGLAELAELAGWAPAWQLGRERTAFHRRLIGHRAGVGCLAFGTVNGRAVLASGDDSGEVRLWDARDGTLLLAFTAHDAMITALAFCPAPLGPGASNQAPLLTGATDGKARCWAPDTGARLAEFAVHKGEPRAFALVRGAVAVGWADEDGCRGGVDLWTPSTGEVRAEVFPELGELYGLVAVGDALIAAGSYCLDVRDAGTFARVTTIEPQGSLVGPLMTTIVGGTTAAISVEQEDKDDYAFEQIVAWHDLATGQQLGQRQLDLSEEALAVGELPGGPMLATIADRRNVRLRPLSEGHSIVELQAHPWSVRAAVFGAIDGAPVLATADCGFWREGRHHNGTVVLWDIPEKHEHSDRGACGLSIGVDGERPIVVIGTDTAMTHVADAITGKLIKSFFADKGEADYASNGGLAIAVGTVGGETRIASGGDAPGVTLWRLSGDRGHTLKFKNHVTALAFGSIGDRVVLAAGGTGEPAALYDPATKERLVTLRESPDVAAFYVQSIAVGSLDGKPIVAVGRSSSLELWDGTAGRRLCRFAGDGTGFALGTIAGRTVLAGSAGPELRIWDASTYQRTATLPHPAPVTCAAMLGHLLVTGDEAGTVHLWDALSGQRLSTLGAFARRVYSVAAATFAEGTYVYAQAHSGRVTACRLGAIGP